MEDFPMQIITIYHKNKGNNWNRYSKEASVRHTSILNHNKSGSNSTDNVLIRIFDTKEYNSTWFASKGDIIVNKEVKDVIEGQTPLTQLKKIYGDDNVYKVTSIDEFIFNDKDIEDLNHIKLGCI